MSIIYNGTEIKKLIYNGSDIKVANYGNTEVYKDGPTKGQIRISIGGGTETATCNPSYQNIITGSQSTSLIFNINNGSITGSIGRAMIFDRTNVPYTDITENSYDVSNSNYTKQATVNLLTPNSPFTVQITIYYFIMNWMGAGGASWFKENTLYHTIRYNGSTITDTITGSANNLNVRGLPNWNTSAIDAGRQVSATIAYY